MRSEEEIKAALESDDPLKVVREIFFGDDCWLFDQRGIPRFDTNYQTLKNDIAGALDLNPKEITLIGSAKIGFSTAPGKIYRAFRKGRSDLDFAIVSPSLFGSIWDDLSIAALQGYTNYVDKHASQIFAKHIVLDSEHVYKSTYLNDVSRKVQSLNKAVNNNIKIKHKVNYPIYSDLRSAEAYHVSGISALRKDLARDKRK